MKRDLKLNYGELESIILKLQKYETSLVTMKSSVASIEKNLKQSDSKAVKELINNFTLSEKDIESCRLQIEEIRKLLSDYILDMSKYATPIKRNQLMQIDRNDVWANIVSIETGIGNLYKAQGAVGRYGSFNQDEDIIAAEESNAKEIRRFNSEVQKKAKKLNEQVDKIWRIYNNRIVPFENTDDEYRRKSEVLYKSNTSVFDKFRDMFKYLKTVRIDFLRGAWNTLVGFLTGTITLGFGIIKFVSSGLCVLNYLPFGDAPEWARNSINKGKDLLKGVLYDPLIIFEGITQSVSDKIDNEGIYYMAGSLAMDIVIAKSIAAAKKKIKGTSGNAISSDKVKFNESSVDKAFSKHGKNFGNYPDGSKASVQAFNKDIKTLIDTGTQVKGTYRSTPGTHIYNPSTRQWVFINADGTFNTAFTLSQQQYKYLIEIGVVK